MLIGEAWNLAIIYFVMLEGTARIKNISAIILDKDGRMGRKDKKVEKCGSCWCNGPENETREGSEMAVIEMLGAKKYLFVCQLVCDLSLLGVLVIDGFCTLANSIVGS